MLPSMSVYFKVFSESTSYSRPQVRSIKKKTREEALFEFISDTKGMWVSETGT